MNIIKFVSIFGSLMMVGCSCFGFSRPGMVDPVAQQLIHMIDTRPLKKGGAVLVSVFRAGPGVEANKDFEEIAFSFSNGMFQGFSGQSDRFTFLSVEKADQADFIIEGHIVATGLRSFPQKIFFRPKTVKFAVEGQIIDRFSGETLVVFRDTSRVGDNNQNHKDLAFFAGQALAGGILEKLQ